MIEMSEFAAIIVSIVVLMSIMMIYDRTGKKNKRCKKE
jgi:hypothetical protein